MQAKTSQRAAKPVADVDPPERPSGEEDFVQLFVAHEPALRAFIFSQVVNWADMSEILQQTSIVLWQKFDRFEPGTDFRSWAFKIARYEVLNYVHKQKRSRLVFSDELIELLATEDPNREDHLECQRVALGSCLKKLPKEGRELVEQFYGDGRSMESLKEQYKKKAMALYQRVHRIRIGLLECVERELRREAREI